MLLVKQKVTHSSKDGGEGGIVRILGDWNPRGTPPATTYPSAMLRRLLLALFRARVVIEDETGREFALMGALTWRYRGGENRLRAG
ncbi:MAG: hypothetical protein AB7J76_12920 [Phycisphaerales bacterium]